jgi:hypothetical protein
MLARELAYTEQLIAEREKWHLQRSGLGRLASTPLRGKPDVTT